MNEIGALLGLAAVISALGSLVNSITKFVTTWRKIPKVGKKADKSIAQDQSLTPERTPSRAKSAFVFTFEVLLITSLFLTWLTGKEKVMTASDGAFFALMVVTYLAMQRPENN